MKSRRSFFKRLAAFAATVAVAPQIAFGVSPITRVSSLAAVSPVDDTYACIMETPANEVTLYSQTWTTQIECPDRNLIIEGFSDAR